MTTQASFPELEETIELFQELIRNECVNPPGNEIKSIKTIERFLKSKGIESRIFESAKNRANLIAKIKGSDESSPGLIFGPSHVDVVPVTKPDEWDVEPFSGEIKDGFIWGRGAIDMLFIVATQVNAFAKLYQEGFKPKGDLILFIVSDEETGGKLGTEWMLENHPEELNIGLRKMTAVTESGGISIAPGKLVFISGEKGTAWKTLRFKGTPLHGSMPFASDNAVLKASEAALLLTEYCDKKIPLETEYISNLTKGMGMNIFLRMLLTNKRLIPLALKILKNTNPPIAKLIHSLSRMTISPNIIRGGSKTNIIAANADLHLDIRTLPSQNESYVIYHLKKALGKLSEEVEILQNTEEGVEYLGSDSPVDSDIIQSMQKAIAKEIEIRNLVPLLGMGATDGRFTRTQGIDTYGFALFDPELPMTHYIDLTHGVNERITIKTVDLSLKIYYYLAKDYLFDEV